MSTRHAAHLTFSLEALASHSGLTSGPRDGWGAAFYQGNDVAQFREPIAASDSPLVRLLERRGPSSTLAILHIRRATLGAVALSSTQPFVRELAGRIHVFAHNWSWSCPDLADRLALGSQASSVSTVTDLSTGGAAPISQAPTVGKSGSELGGGKQVLWG